MYVIPMGDPILTVAGHKGEAGATLTMGRCDFKVENHTSAANQAAPFFNGSLRVLTSKYFTEKKRPSREGRTELRSDDKLN